MFRKILFFFGESGLKIVDGSVDMYTVSYGVRGEGKGENVNIL